MALVAGEPNKKAELELRADPPLKILPDAPQASEITDQSTPYGEALAAEMDRRFA